MKRLHKHTAAVTALCIIIICMNSCGGKKDMTSDAEALSMDKKQSTIKEKPHKAGPEITLFWLTSDDHTSYRLITFDLKAESKKTISGWHISEDPGIPSPDDPRWKDVKPETYLLSLSEGLKNIYARARDMDNNISSAAALTVLLDRTQPEIVAFDMKKSRSDADPRIPLDILTDEDTTELSWFIGEDEEPPERSSYLWQSVCPESYLVSQGDGYKTINLWIMDGAGNISDKKSLSVYYKTQKCLITWEPSRAYGVNSPGGGYEVFYSRERECDPERAFKKTVTYNRKQGTPSETVLGLGTGTWYIRVRGFSGLRGKTTGELSDTINIKVTD